MRPPNLSALDDTGGSMEYLLQRNLRNNKLVISGEKLEGYEVVKSVDAMDWLDAKATLVGEMTVLQKLLVSGRRLHLT